MVLKRKLAEDEEKLIAPTAEITRIDVEDGGDVVPDVADGNGLRVELEESHSFVVKHGCAQIRHRRTSRWRTRRLRRDGDSSSRALFGSPCQGIAGALCSGITLRGCSLGFVFGLDGTC